MDSTNLSVQSNKTLIKASLIALIIAVIALVTLILPAEYNIDPTGIGKATGLTQLATTKPAQVEQTSQSTASQQLAHRSDTINIDIPAGRGVEYKFYLPQFGKMSYNWATETGQLYFDFHGEPQGDTTGFYESFTIATSKQMEGSLTTPFAGSHGWYWRNDTNSVIRVKLTTSGAYNIIGLKQ